MPCIVWRLPKNVNIPLHTILQMQASIFGLSLEDRVSDVGFYRLLAEYGSVDATASSEAKQPSSSKTTRGCIEQIKHAPLQLARYLNNEWGLRYFGKRPGESIARFIFYAAGLGITIWIGAEKGSNFSETYLFFPKGTDQNYQTGEAPGAVFAAIAGDQLLSRLFFLFDWMRLHITCCPLPPAASEAYRKEDGSALLESTGQQFPQTQLRLIDGPGYWSRQLFSGLVNTLLRAGGGAIFVALATFLSFMNPDDFEDLTREQTTFVAVSIVASALVCRPPASAAVQTTSKISVIDDENEKVQSRV